MDIEDIKFYRDEVEQGGYSVRQLQHQIKHCGGTCHTCKGDCPGNCGDTRTGEPLNQGWRPGPGWKNIPPGLKAQRAMYKKFQMESGFIKKRIAVFGNDLGCFPRAKEENNAHQSE